MTGDLSRRLRKSDSTIAKTVVRYLRSLGREPGITGPYIDPTRPDPAGTSGPKHVERLKEEGGL